ncbi:MAG: signal peptide peptidase SppA [Bdellovibrionales bacterium]
MKQFFKVFFGSFLGAAFGVTFGLFFLIAGLAAAISALSGAKEGQSSQSLKEDSVIVLNLAQKITELSDENMLGVRETYNLHDIRESLETASEDDRIQGVIIKMTSATPIGWSTAKELRKVLADFAESKKRIVAFGEVADEKSLYIASVAKKIYMHPTGEVKWNGFASTSMFYKGLFDKLEMEPVIFKAGKFKSAIEPFINKKMSPESRQQTEELLEDLWEETLEVVSAARNIDASDLREFAEDAAVRTAKQAKKIDLIDGVIQYTDLVERFLQKKPEDGEEKIPLKKADLRKLVSIKGYESLKEENLFAALEKGSLFSRSNKKKNKIAVLVLEGAIMPGPSEKGTIGSDTVVEELQKIRFDKKIKGLVLRINSPGGSALASDVIWYEVEKLKAKKPVYVSMGDVAASGGYYIAAGANKIFADVNTITGSIGVFSVLFNTEKAFESKVGLTFDRVVTNRYADLGSGVRSMGEEEKEIFQRDVQRIYKNFLGVVEKGRSYTSFNDVEMVAQGRVWSGAQAKQVGLVDQLGGLEDCTVALAGELKLDDYDLDFYPKKRAFEGLLGGILGAGAKLKTVEEALSSPLEYTKKIKKSLSHEQILMLSPYAITIN